MQSLADKVAVVLGASAQAGTGWGIAEALAAQGAKVVVAARTFEPLQTLAAKIGGHAVRCDAGDFEQIAHLRDEALRVFGRIDIAVNSAATPTLSLIKDVTPAVMQQGAQVNYFGMAYFVRHMSEGMNDDGSIVLMSSMSATHPILPHFSYACSKAATEALIKYAAVELGPRRIRVNGIRIATVYSDMAKALYDSPGVADAFLKEVPLGRWGYPEDMARAVIWLSSGVYVTGSVLDVSGGHHINRFPFLSELTGGDQNYEGSGALGDRLAGRGYKSGAD